jgi:TetR/AcrR family tetracycline transcriptional repressor
MPGATDKREPQRAPGLSRERILDAALDVAADEGLEALSMRRLALALDVWPMALYRYFRDKDELLDAMVARATDQIERPPPMGSWRQQMRGLLRGACEALGGDGLGLGERLPRVLVTPGLVRLAEDGLRILDEAGFDAQEAPRAWRALLSYTIGYAAQGPGEEADFEYGLERLLDGLEAALRRDAVA